MSDIDLTGSRVARSPRRRSRIESEHARHCPRLGYVWAAAAAGKGLDDIGRCRGCGRVARRRPTAVTGGLKVPPVPDHTSVFHSGSQAAVESGRTSR